MLGVSRQWIRGGVFHFISSHLSVSWCSGRVNSLEGYFNLLAVWQQLWGVWPSVFWSQSTFCWNYENGFCSLFWADLFSIHSLTQVIINVAEQKIYCDWWMSCLLVLISQHQAVFYQHGNRRPNRLGRCREAGFCLENEKLIFFSSRRCRELQVVV